MSDREYYEISMMGCVWDIQLHFHDHGFDSNKNNGEYYVSGNSVLVNFRKITSTDHLIGTVFDGLFDLALGRFCGEEWDSKMLAQATAQVINNTKSRRAIDEMVTYFTRYHHRGDEYEKFDVDGVLQEYMFDSIELKGKSYWGFEIWFGHLKDKSFELSRFGFTEEYILTIDATKFDNGGDIASLLDEQLRLTTTSEFQGLDEKSAYTEDVLMRKLKSTDYEVIKSRLIDEYNDIVSEYDI
jgi:hypothetical protein